MCRILRVQCSFRFAGNYNWVCGNCVIFHKFSCIIPYSPPFDPLIIILLAHFADLLSVSWAMEGGVQDIYTTNYFICRPNWCNQCSPQISLLLKKKMICKLQMKLHALPLEKSAGQKTQRQK